MPNQEHLDNLRTRFEAARCFEDDDEYLSTISKSTNTSRRSTLSKQPAVKSTHKKFPPTKPSVRKESKLKWEPSKEYAPRNASQDYTAEKTARDAPKISAAAPEYTPRASTLSQEYAPGEISGYGTGGEENWTEGGRLDEYGRPVRMISGEEWDPELDGQWEEQTSQWSHSRGESTASTSNMNGEFAEPFRRSAVRRSEDPRLWQPPPRSSRKHAHRKRKSGARAKKTAIQDGDTMLRPLSSGAGERQGSEIEDNVDDAQRQPSFRGMAYDTHTAQTNR